MTIDAPQGDAPQKTAKPRTLALITGGGLLAGALIVVGAIMPAEFNVDPLGIGKATGISRLWAPDSQTYTGDSALAFISDAPRSVHRVDIPLGAAGWDESSLEYKVLMSPGQSILFSWSARHLDGSPVIEPIEFDMHGHDVVAEGEAETVVQFPTGRAVSQQGSLTAPMDGIYGWYFRNHDPDPIVIRLQVEGYFAVIPPGEPGNEFRIRPLPEAPDILDGPAEPF